MTPVPPLWMQSPSRYPSMMPPGCNCSRMTEISGWLDRTLDSQFHAVRQRAGQAAASDVVSGRHCIVGNTKKSKLLLGKIEQRIRGRWITVTRLAHGPDDHDPAAVIAHRNRGTGKWPELAHPPLRVLEVKHLVMHVAAESVASVCSVGAAFRGCRTVDVVPTFRRRRRRMGETDRFVAHDKRQRSEEIFLLLGQRLACPLQCRARRVVEIAAPSFDRLVVVALENHRTCRGIPRDDLDNSARITAITH